MLLGLAGREELTLFSGFEANMAEAKEMTEIICPVHFELKFDIS